MLVNLVVGVFGAVTFLCIASAVVWALTRASDRIQMATACLFLATLMYFASGAQLYARGGVLGGIGVVLVLYAAALYVALAVLALYYKRWAWQVAIGAFAVHLLLGVGLVVIGVVGGTVAIGGLSIWFLVGAIGLWACLQSGSRELVSSVGA